jgi:hypothetical protein
LVLGQPRFPGTTAANGRNVTEDLRSADLGSNPVLVELFTSEGCSSCPPADALLARLGRTQPVHGADIIALEEHVDYWDRLGWKDPFSSEAATDRQNEYGSAFGDAQVYTPQMIVDGRAQFVGSSVSDALRAIGAASRTPKPAIQLSWEKDDSLSIHVDPQGNAKSPAQQSAQENDQRLFLVVAENRLHSDVKRGENAGRALEHDGVVRHLLPVGKIDNAAAGFSSTVPVHAEREWNRANLRAVVFIQERHTRHIIAAAAIPFPSA